MTPAKLRILLADDDRIVQLAHETLLKRLCDCDVVIANDGAEAVRSVAEGFDMLLIDIHMPILNGIEATIQIRSNPLIKTLPIIGITSDPNPTAHKHCLEAGMNEVFLKPVSADTLKHILKQYLHV